MTTSCRTFSQSLAPCLLIVLILLTVAGPFTGAPAILPASPHSLDQPRALSTASVTGLPSRAEPSVPSRGIERANPNAESPNSVNVGSGPVSATYDDSNGYVYVVNSWSNNVSVIDSTAVIASVNVGGNPTSVAFDGSNGYVYVTNGLTANVSVLNGTKVVTAVAVGSSPVSVLCVTSNGYVYVMNSGSGNISVLRGTAVVASLTIGVNPGQAVYDVDDGYVYVTNRGSDFVTVLSGTTIQALVQLGGHSLSAVYDSADGYVYVSTDNATSGDAVSVINGTSVLASIPVGPLPVSLTFNQEYDFLYVSSEGSGYVTVLNGTTVEGSVMAGGSPCSAAYDAGNGFVYVANCESNNVTVFNGTTRASTVTVGNHPDSLVYNAGNGNLYVVNFNSSNVSILATPASYVVSFQSSAWEGGLRWSVDLAGHRAFSTNLTVAYTVPNGSYAFVVYPASGYYAQPSAGIVMVNGTNVIASITFSRATYSVDFVESGLPLGTNWSVTLGGGTPHSSTSATIGFMEPNGSYPFWIGIVPDWTTPVRYGYLDVNGAPVSRSIAWALPEYGVTFSEVGLPARTTWSIVIDGFHSTSTTPQMRLMEANGTYPYSVDPNHNYREASYPPSPIVVHGAAVQVAINFTPILSVTASEAYQHGSCRQLLPVYLAVEGSVTGGLGPYQFNWTSQNGSPRQVLTNWVSSAVSWINFSYAAWGRDNISLEAFDSSGFAGFANTTVFAVPPSGCPILVQWSFLGLSPTEVLAVLGAISAATILAAVGVIRRRRTRGTGFVP
jgi:YVTN family beta-propeller protein